MTKKMSKHTTATKGSTAAVAHGSHAKACSKKTGAPESLKKDGFMFINDGVGKGKDFSGEESSSDDEGKKVEDALEVNSEDELGMCMQAFMVASWA